MDVVLSSFKCDIEQSYLTMSTLNYMFACAAIVRFPCLLSTLAFKPIQFRGCSESLKSLRFFDAIAPMAASQKLALPKPRSVRFIRLWSSIIGKSRIGTNQHAYTDYFWHFVHKTKSQWASSIFESHSACSVCLVRSPVHSERRVKCL